MPNERGVFTISLDTELSWGTFDVGRIDEYEPAYRETRIVVDRLCSLFDEYDVSATWAIVAHLLDDCTGKHDSEPGPSYNWIDDWYAELPCVSDIGRSLWFAPDIVADIQNCSAPQEIGLHGYSHLLFGEPGCDRATAQREIRKAVTVLENHGVDPVSFVFPRNRVGHRDVLADAGIEVYRGRDARWHERATIPDIVRKPLRFFEEFSRRTPPTSTPRRVDGLVEVPGSQVFRPFHDGWQFTPPSSRVVKAKRGLDRAVKRGEVFHLRFHPFDLGFDPDRLFSHLDQILQYATNLRQNGGLDILTMSAVGRELKEGRWASNSR